MKLKIITRSLFYPVAAILFLASCEGPMGPAGLNGQDGQDGTDANETCKTCHNSVVVDAKSREYSYSVHATGEEYTRGTRNDCAPCHSHQGFMDVVSRNVSASFVTDPADNSKFINSYVASSSALSLPGSINCFTCHSSLHTNYNSTEFLPLTTTTAVAMTMYGGTKSLDFAQESSNLCAKCHQPRPITGADGNVINYTALVSNPDDPFTMASVGYRTGIHYGPHSAMAAGIGGIEFGTGYSNSAHTEDASCTSCHMAAPSGMAGGHSFTTTANFNGCNVSGCHSGMSASGSMLQTVTDNISDLIDQLAEEINAIGNGNDILQKDPEDGLYHGYLDVYDRSGNPDGYWKNPALGNVALPQLTNAQFAAIINFQLVVRDGSMGVHNYPYIKKLLENTLEAI
jgi:hypothetical protein